MSRMLDDERVAFFLRHREDIKQWAGIEREMIRAVKYMLRDLQAGLEQEARAVDPRATSIRLDHQKWERIVIRHADWPRELGVTLEWQASQVDPFGGSLPKIGVFFAAREAGEREMREALLERFKQTGGFAELGFTLGVESVWPVLRIVPKSKDWWTDPDAWLRTIQDDMRKLWMKTAPLMSELATTKPRG